MSNAELTPGPELPTFVRFSFGAPSNFGRITQVALLRDSRGHAHSLRITDSYALVYSLDGIAHYQDENGLVRDIKPGDVILVFPDMRHKYGPGPDEHWSEFYLVFDGPVFDLWRQQKLLDPTQPILHCEPVDYWLKRLESVPSAPRQPGGEMTEACRLQEILAEMLTASKLQEKDTDRQLIARACALLESDLSRELDLPKLAQQLGISYASFRKQFTRIMGVPPARYRTVKLIERACELMQRSEFLDKQIAEQLGFSDEFHFSRRFKAVTGMSPRAFRRTLPRTRE